MDSASLLEAYRRDRRRLLGFLLSAAGDGGHAVDLSRVDLDAVSADYALECVASGKARSLMLQRPQGGTSTRGGTRSWYG